MLRGLWKYWRGESHEWACICPDCKPGFLPPTVAASGSITGGDGGIEEQQTLEGLDREFMKKDTEMTRLVEEAQETVRRLEKIREEHRTNQLDQDIAQARASLERIEARHNELFREMVAARTRILEARSVALVQSLKDISPAQRRQQQQQKKTSKK